jgi:hypothetical protein
MQQWNGSWLNTATLLRWCQREEEEEEERHVVNVFNYFTSVTLLSISVF